MLWSLGLYLHPETKQGFAEQSARYDSQSKQEKVACIKLFSLTSVCLLGAQVT